MAERRFGIEDDVRQRIPPPARIGRQRPPLVGPRVPEQSNAIRRPPVFEAVGRRLGRLRALAAIARIGRVEIGSIGNDRLENQDARRRHDVGSHRDQIAEPERADRARTKHAQPAGPGRRRRFFAAGLGKHCRLGHHGKIRQPDFDRRRQDDVLAARRERPARRDLQPDDVRRALGPASTV